MSKLLVMPIHMKQRALILPRIRHYFCEATGTTLLIPRLIDRTLLEVCNKGGNQKTSVREKTPTQLLVESGQVVGWENLDWEGGILFSPVHRLCSNPSLL